MHLKNLLIVLVSVSLLALSGCSSMNLGGSSSSTSPVTDRILASGEFRVGMSGNQPPFNMRDASGELMGMDVDLALSLARNMGVKAKLVTMPFKDLLPALERGEIDAVFSGVTMTSQRNLKVAFAGPYFISGKAALTKSQDLASAGAPADMNKPEKMVVLAGSTSERFARSELAQVELVTVPDYDEAVRMVLDDEVAAMIADYPVTILALYQHPGAGLATTISKFSFEPIGVALPSNAHLLTNTVQNYFALLEGTGMLERLRQMWFENDSWVQDLP